MITLVRTPDVTLHELETNFNLHLDESHDFFPEWRAGQHKVEQLTDHERQQLDRIRQGYLNLVKFPPMLEDTVKMVILSPLLYLAGYYLEPFHFQSEFAIRLASQPFDDPDSTSNGPRQNDNDSGVTIEGKIDFLILKEQFWFMVIESKRVAFSIEAGLAQILAYMLASPNQQTVYGLITTGGSFVFLKLVYGEAPRYALSKSFEMRDPDNEFYQVLAILKHLVDG